MLSASLRSRVWAIWRRIFDLAWPMMTEQVLRTLMRTTDLIVAGFFAPAAVAAVGLADIYARLPLRMGLGVGDSAIALSSQDTGAGAAANRDQASTQALLVGLIAGIPFVLFGLFLSEPAIAILGILMEEGAGDVVEYGSVYLMVIMVTAPAIHVNFIAARAIQGTGDTVTPMVVNGAVNAFNIVVTVTLAFGVGPFPELGIVGIASATAIANTIAAVTFLTLIWSDRTEVEYVVPERFIIAKQILVIAAPRIGEGVSEMIAEFPFNAILLGFGTEVNAGYHIGRRMYNQIVAPLSRGYGVASNIVVGQALGRQNPGQAYFNGLAATALSVLSIGGLLAGLFLLAEEFVLVFTRDAMTIDYGVAFAQTYAVTGILMSAHICLAGALRGGSETVAPFVGRMMGTVVFLLGFTYVFGVHLGYGVTAAYVAILLDFLTRVLYLSTVYARKRWLDRGTDMMVDRGSISAPAED